MIPGLLYWYCRHFWFDEGGGEYREAPIIPWNLDGVLCEIGCHQELSEDCGVYFRTRMEDCCRKLGRCCTKRLQGVSLGMVRGKRVGEHGGGLEIFKL